MKYIYQKGVTLAQMLIVLAVLGLLVAVVLPKFKDLRDAQVLKDASLNTLSAINKASAQSLASVDSSEYGVRFNSNSVVIFRGTSYASSTLNETINLVSPAFISDVTLNGTSTIPGEVYFDRLTSAPSKTGTVTISNGSLTEIITIGATGIVSIGGSPAAATNFSLNVVVVGGGEVSSGHGEINCNPTCSSNFPSGDPVTLTASAGKFSTFSGWSGDCSGTDTCDLTMDTNKNVTATFSP